MKTRIVSVITLVFLLLSILSVSGCSKKNGLPVNKFNEQIIRAFKSNDFSLLAALLRTPDHLEGMQKDYHSSEAYKSQSPEEKAVTDQLAEIELKQTRQGWDVARAGMEESFRRVIQEAITDYTVKWSDIELTGFEKSGEIPMGDTSEFSNYSVWFRCKDREFELSFPGVSVKGDNHLLLTGDIDIYEK